MTSIWCPGFLLFLFHYRVVSETPEPMFRVLGSNIELGYCFGVDYIAVYRSAPEGYQLLGNTSANTPITPPVDLQGRIRVNQQESLLGLQISSLTHMDSRTYRKECWTDHILVSQLTQQLIVCDEEVEPEQIIVSKGTTTTTLLCKGSSTESKETSVRWYMEKYPDYKVTLFMDSSVKLDSLVEELRVAESRYRGRMLVLDNDMFESIHHFYCVVMKDDNCLSFHNLYIENTYTESMDIYASQGDPVVLNCNASGHDQHWETPVGRINVTSRMKNQVYISSEDKNFSLVIPSVSDELAGEYSCISSSFERQYSLVLCPKTVISPQMLVSEGEDVVLNCDTDQGDHTVQWYRRQTSMEYEFIYDSDSDTLSIPVNLSGRLTRPTAGYSLRISSLKRKDEGLYFCVVLAGLTFMEKYEYIVDDADEEQNMDYESEDEDNWYNQKCIRKQETVLTIDSQARVSPTHDWLPHIIVCCVVIGLALLAVVIAVIVRKKKKRKQSHEQDIHLNQRLTT